MTILRRFRQKEIPVLTRRSTARSEQGQVLVIVAVGLLAMIAMVALVVDGGHAWGQQREAQNGADASSEAGAVPPVTAPVTRGPPRSGPAPR